MNLNPKPYLINSLRHSKSSLRSLISISNPLMAPSVAETLAQQADDSLCADSVPDDQLVSELVQESILSVSGSTRREQSGGESRIERAWAHWRKLGQPKLIVAPMVDSSELPFRMLCRKYGAEAAYTPMLHARIFSESEKYRSEEFTTCKEDRPLFVQFCANDPDILLEAAKRVEPYCDYVDLNLGCPQRIAKRGNYGAFLMDNLPVVKSLVEKLANNLIVPVSCKIRVFPKLEDTIKYARMLEDAGCALLAVHGRTRDQKDQRKVRADWKIIKAVRESVKIPVLANGNVRHMEDVYDCLQETGVEGVLSAETLLENPAVFAGYRTPEWASNEDKTLEAKLDQGDLLIEYLKLCEKYPVPWRMIRAHVHKMLGVWFSIHPEVREELNSQRILTFEFLYGLVDRLRELGVRVPLYVKENTTNIPSSV
ncbi:unnamed protein product [Rhodiola kirilowii]